MKSVDAGWNVGAGVQRKTRGGGGIKKKKGQPVTQELNKVSPLITRAWTGPRQEKP